MMACDLINVYVCIDICIQMFSRHVLRNVVPRRDGFASYVQAHMPGEEERSSFTGRTRKVPRVAAKEVDLLMFKLVSLGIRYERLAHYNFLLQGTFRKRSSKSGGYGVISLKLERGQRGYCEATCIEQLCAVRSLLRHLTLLIYMLLPFYTAMSMQTPRRQRSCPCLTLTKPSSG